MVLIDASVWIDFFRGTRTVQTDRLMQLLGTQRAAVGDIVMTEVLQGFSADRDFRLALDLLGRLTLVPIVDRSIAIKSAENFRFLRARGFTIRKTIDTLIATRCIEDGLELLYSDRDFDPFVTHLGLVSAMKTQV